MATTVSVDQWDKIYSLKNNGKVDASNDADMPTQIIVGLLPFLFYSQPHPPKVALVGYGSGVTAGAITQYPIQSLEVVELEAAVYRGSRFFDNDNHRPLQNPKVTARVGDGRNFLTQRSDKFDVIVSEPSNPWLTGVSNLFTREYFKLVKTRLADARHLLPVGAALRDGALEHQDDPRHGARGVPLRLRVRGRGLVVGHDPDRQHGAAAAGLRRRRARVPGSGDARRGAARRLPVAARRVRLPAARPRRAGGVHGRLARSTPTTTRASSSRRRAICSATPSSSRTAPTSTARCGPTAACPSWCAGTTTAPRRAAAAALLGAQPARPRQVARGGAVDPARGGGRRLARGAARAPAAEAGLDAPRSRSGDPARARRGAGAADGARLPGGQAPGAGREGEGGVSGGAGPLPRAPLRHRLQGAREAGPRSCGRAWARTSRC